MTETIVTVVWIVWPPVAAWLVLKLLPFSIEKYIGKEIDRRSDIKLEKVKAELQGSYSTLQRSVDVLNVSNSAIQPHIIAAVSELWTTIVTMREQFGGVAAFDSVILANEAVEAFANQGDAKHAKVLGFVRPHEGDLQNPVRAAAFLNANLDKHRLFCGDRLWLVFYVIRAVHMRSSLLIAWSFQKKAYQDWRSDSGIAQLLESALTKEFVAKVRGQKLSGLAAAMAQLEAEFLHESVRVMSGSKAMADSLANVQSIMLLQNAKVAEQPKP